MKTTPIVVENDKDHAEAMALLHRLMASDDPRDVARLRVQARLIEDYERALAARGADAARPPRLPDGPARAHARRPGAPVRHREPSERSAERQAELEPRHGAAAEPAVPHPRRPSDRGVAPQGARSKESSRGPPQSGQTERRPGGAQAQEPPRDAGAPAAGARGGVTASDGCAGQARA